MHHAVANVFKGYEEWVYSKARHVNLEEKTERLLVRRLSELMEAYRAEQEWGAVSSNNIYWDATDMPIRIIQIPDPEDHYLTFVNPKIQKLDGGPVMITEACGSLPGIYFLVPRFAYTIVEGEVVEDNFRLRSLDYGGNVKPYTMKIPVEHLSEAYSSAFAQHECDHLDGKIVSERTYLHCFQGEKKPSEFGLEIFSMLKENLDVPLEYTIKQCEDGHIMDLEYIKQYPKLSYSKGIWSCSMEDSGKISLPMPFDLESTERLAGALNRYDGSLEEMLSHVTTKQSKKL